MSTEPSSSPPPDPDAPAIAAGPEPDIGSLHPFGYNDRVAALISESAPSTTGGDRQIGRVVRVDRGIALVQLDADQDPIAVPTMLAPKDDVFAVGDWILVPADGLPESGALTILPRWSAISRLDSDGISRQVLATNLDLIGIVQGLDRPLKPGRLDRALVLAWESGAKPIVILTKSDLSDDPGAAVREVKTTAKGIKVLVTHARTGDPEGLAAVRNRLQPDRTLVLIGESGAGKSTLVNALLDHDRQATGAVREGDAKGRHTTTRRELIAVPGGGVVIDTPGVRSLGLWGGDAGMSTAFADVEALGEQCRFRDCAHTGEPGCAVGAAVKAGTIDAARVARFLELRHEIDDKAERETVDRQRKRGGRPGQRPPQESDDDDSPRRRW